MRILFFSCFLLLFSLSAIAQGNQKRTERIQAFRAAVFTEVLDLSPAEAEVFWPLYNEFQEKRNEIGGRSDRHQNIDGMSDAEIEAQIEKHFEQEQKELDLRKEYMQKFKKILPLRKAAKIPMAERKFRESLLKKMAERRRDNDKD